MHSSKAKARFEALTSCIVEWNGVSPTWRYLLLGLYIGYSIDLWIVFRTKFMWCLWLHRLDALLKERLSYHISLKKPLLLFVGIGVIHWRTKLNEARRTAVLHTKSKKKKNGFLVIEIFKLMDLKVFNVSRNAPLVDSLLHL